MTVLAKVKGRDARFEDGKWVWCDTGEQVNSSSITMWTLVHIDENNSDVIDESGFPALVNPIDEFSCGMLFDIEENAKKAAKNHNTLMSDGGYEIPCRVVPVTILF